VKFRKITFIIIVLFLVSLTINGALSLINDNNVKYVKYDINNKKKVDLINEMYDLTIHTEFLSSEIKFLNTDTNPKANLLNLGAILGRTDKLSDKLILRSEASIYKSMIFNTDGYADRPKPSLTSGMISSSLYREFSLSKSISLLPNAGAFLGYGNYSAPFSSANLRQGFDNFLIGPRVGFDSSFKLSDAFFLVVKPEIMITLNREGEDSSGTLLFNILLNF